MFATRRKRWVTSTLAAILVLIANLAGPVVPASAGESGSGGGQIIYNTVYKTVVKQDVSYNTILNVPGLVGNPLTGVDLSNDSGITSALRAVGVDPNTIAISRAQTLLSTTSTDIVTRTVEESQDAIVIGDPYGDLGDVFVVQGTLTVTDTDTTINTQHILETVTITGNLVSTPCAVLSVAEGTVGHRTRVVANVVSPCQGGAPFGFLFPINAPPVHDLHLSTLVVQGHRAIVYGWGKTGNGATTDFELDASTGVPHGTMRFRLSTGYDSGNLPAVVVALRVSHHDRFVR